MEPRTQGSRPRPQKKIRGQGQEQPSKGRPSQSQGQECSRPRPQAQVIYKKKVFKNFFQAISKKKVFKKFFKPFPGEKNKIRLCKFYAAFLAFSNKILTVQIVVLSSSKGRAIFADLRLRGHGQGLQNVSLRTSLGTPLLLFISISFTYLHFPNLRCSIREAHTHYRRFPYTPFLQVRIGIRCNNRRRYIVPPKPVGR